MPAPSIERCPTCGRKKRRSHPQNKMYWSLVFLMAERLKPQGERYSPETWHRYLANRFLGANEYNLPNGKTMVIPRSTADLDKHEFSEYYTQVEQFAAEHGVYLDELEEMK